MIDPVTYLLNHGGWVPAKQLASICGMNERSFRGEDSPIRRYAISGDKGYRHIRCATEEEVDHYFQRLRKHAIEELRHANTIKRLRSELGPIVQTEFFKAA